MSECVVRMEIPNGCHDCKLRNMIGNCPIPMFDGLDEEKIYTLAECFQRPPWCPIVCSLPKGHGRLVDVTKIDFVMFTNEDSTFRCGWNNGVRSVMQHAETIVPAEAEGSEK